MNSGSCSQMSSSWKWPIHPSTLGLGLVNIVQLQLVSLAAVFSIVTQREERCVTILKTDARETKGQRTGKISSTYPDYVTSKETHIPSYMCFPYPGTHISSDMCFPCPGTHILSDMCFRYPGTHISSDMCFPFPGTHISSDMCFPYQGTHIPSDMCFPYPGTHIPSDMCFPCPGTHFPSNMCFPYPGTHISRDNCFPTWETHIPSDMCFPYPGSHIPSDIFFPFPGTRMNLLGLCWRVILPIGWRCSGILRQTVLFTAFHISWSVAFNLLWSEVEASSFLEVHVFSILVPQPVVKHISL